MKIILLGYMSCGKTYVGRLLSKIVKLSHIDLDKLIECVFKSTIKEIFNKYGEDNFRIIEKITLDNFIKNYKNKKYIFSLGGGTPCFYNNLKYVKKLGKTFYLKTNYKILYQRLSKDYTNRPMLNKYKKKELFFFIKNSLKYRNQFYNKSEYIINTDNMTFKKIAHHIYTKYCKKHND